MLNILLSERRTKSLIGIKVAKAAHCCEHSIATETKTIKTEAVNFLLSAYCNEVLNIVTWSGSLEVDHDQTFKATGLVFFLAVNLFVSGSIFQRV